MNSGGSAPFDRRTNIFFERVVVALTGVTAMVVSMKKPAGQGGR